MCSTSSMVPVRWCAGMRERALDAPREGGEHGACTKQLEKLRRSAAHDGPPQGRCSWVRSAPTLGSRLLRPTDKIVSVMQMIAARFR